MSDNILFYENGNLLLGFALTKAKIFAGLSESCSEWIHDFEEREVRHRLEDKYLVRPIVLLHEKKYLLPLETSQFNPRFTKKIFSQKELRILRTLSEFAPHTYKLTIAIPFTGDEHLCYSIPSSFWSKWLTPPIGRVTDSELHIYFWTRTPDKISEESIAKIIKKTTNWVDWINKDAQKINKEISLKIQTIIPHLNKTQEKLLQLNIPIRKRLDLPPTVAIPLEQKSIPVAPNPLLEGVPEKGYEIDNKTYEDILEILNNVSWVMERNPKTFSRLGEEAIRDHFLLQLNGHFKGEATGETFNNQGKTDILIRHEGKNMFIGECKIWNGRSELNKAIDQLLSYVSWRDTKVAVLVFSRNKEFTRVLKEIEEIGNSHECFKSRYDLERQSLHSESIFSFIYRNPQDDRRTMFLTILSFNIPNLKSKTTSQNENIR